MATVVITFFLLTRFYVCKMDANCIDRRRNRILSRREKRWSMNSQRLEEIVAELMKPISDVRRSFDTDLSALLEEYLTEAGLHALEAGESEDEEGEGLASPVAPNFAELALLLQHSASVYGRKVDFLYQHVLAVSDSLQQSTQEIERSANETETEASASASPGGRRRRRASAAAAAAAGAGAFAALALAAHGGALREAGAARPPPTLPRAYLELEPRTPGAADLPLTDYDAEPVGLLADFHVSWRLHDGMLVDELEGWGRSGGSLRPIPLMELQAAIEAAAPPALPPPPPDPLDPPPERDHTPPRDLSPLPLHASTPLPPPEPPLKRKRKCDSSTDDLVGGCFKIILNKELRRKFRKLEEFSLEGAWVSGVLRARRDHILARRRCVRDHEQNFRGFDECDLDIGGFAGWSSGEAASTAQATPVLAGAAAAAEGGAACEGDSDDDGFFEQSSLGDSDASRVDDSTLASPSTLAALDNSAWSSWQAGVVARATAGEARGLDVRELAQRVIAHLPPLPPPAPGGAGEAPLAHCCALLRSAARDPGDVPGLFLATLFLANSGNVEVVQPPPLTLNSFSLRLLSADPRLYAASASEDPHFLR